MRNKLLDVIQTWSKAFEKEPAYRVVPNTYNALKLEGYEFPTFNPQVRHWTLESF